MVKKSILSAFFCFFLLYTFSNCQAQKILKTFPPNAINFPKIEGEIWYRGFGNSALTKDQLSISENSKPVDFTLSESDFKSNAPSNKRVLLLIENHWLPIGNAERAFFTEVISKVIPNSINSGDQVMVSSFDWFRDGKYLYNELTDYTDNTDDILNAVKSIKAKSFRKQPQTGSDINQSLLEALEFLGESSDSLPTAIFLFSDEMDNIVNKIQPIDIKIESIKRNIPIYAISYFNSTRYGQIIKNQICLPTYGDYYVNKSNNTDSCADFFNEFMNSMIEHSRGSLYKYAYTSTADKDQASLELTFEVKHMAVSDKTILKLPNITLKEWVMKNKIISAAVVVFFLLLIVLILLFIRKVKSNRLKQDKELALTQLALKQEEEKRALEKKQTEEELMKIKTEQQEKELKLEREKIEALKNIEISKLTQLMNLKGSFPKLNYVFNDITGIVEINKPIFQIGRDTNNDFYIQLNTVSKIHATISFNENGYFTIKDNNSSNGTFVNGERITELELKNGDFIEIGDIGITFQN